MGSGAKLAFTRVNLLAQGVELPRFGVKHS